MELLAAKLDLLMKRLDDHDKRPQGTVKALDSHVTCEVCGGTGHSGNDCPETREEAMYMGNNGYRPQGGQGWNQPRPYYQGGNNNGNFSNQPSLKDLVFAQAKTTNALSKMLVANDKILENINVKLDGFASAFQNQLSFNKMIETQLAHLASLVPANETGRISGQPDSSVESVKAITTRGGCRTAEEAAAEEEPDLAEAEVSSAVPSRCGGGCLDGQRMAASKFNQALCDLGASVSVIPKDVFDKLNFTVLAPTPMCLQLADSSVRYPAGIAEDVPVKIRDFFIPVDFVVLDMDRGKETPLILGRPFLSTAGANINVETGSIRFHINGKEEKFEFQPRKEQCSMVRIKYRPNPQNIQVVEVEPPKTDSLVKFMQNFLEKETIMPRNRYWRTPVKPPIPAKKLEQSAQRKPPSAPKPMKVWREKPKTPAPSPPMTGRKSAN
uniref:Retroelement n=1 Tax=Oryza sativa subsp. japonica TaxID=39947 RepID=Q94HR2_ORYSJ|nr:Putative retroelement [Oryza sativa Japonica Group]